MGRSLSGLAVFALLAAGAPCDARVDLMFALDNSGSMRTSDPKKLMPAEMGRFIEGLSGNVRVGLVVFDSGSRRALPLTSVESPDFAGRLRGGLAGIDYHGRLTDIPGGVEACIYELQHSADNTTAAGSSLRRGIVLFTDGNVDLGNPARDMARASWLRNELAQSAAASDIRIFGIGLAQAADYELLNSLATTTRARYFKLDDLSELPGVLRQIRDILDQPLPIRASPPAPPPSPGSVGVFWYAAAALAAILAWFAWRVRPSAPLPVNAWLRDTAKVTGNELIPISRRSFRCGRSRADNDLVIDDTHVSHRHAVISYPWWGFGKFFVYDLKSANGTFVNGEAIGRPDRVTRRLLKPGDSIRIDCNEFDLVASPSGWSRMVPASASGGTAMRTPSPKPAPPPSLPRQGQPQPDPFRTVPPASIAPGDRADEEPTRKKP